MSAAQMLAQALVDGAVSAFPYRARLTLDTEIETYLKYDRQVVTVLELKGGALFRFQADDGFSGHAFPDELERVDEPAPAAACTVPPEGWRCTREHGHEGSCAAWPTQGDELRVAIGQALSEDLTADGGQRDWFDARNIDALVDVVLKVHPLPGAA